LIERFDKYLLVINKTDLATDFLKFRSRMGLGHIFSVARRRTAERYIIGDMRSLQSSPLICLDCLEFAID
jgi:hypothetical protein